MRYRRLGSSGLPVSVVGLGTNHFGRKVDAAAAAAIIDAGIDAGITLIDTADVYGEPQGSAEELVGAALRNNRRRDEAVVATKFGNPRTTLNGAGWEAKGGRRYLHRAVESSLRRLGTDYIDLYQLHRPDALTPIEETLHALDDLVRAGKVRYLGSSNLSGWQIADAAWTARAASLTPFVSAQNEYSWLDRAIEREAIPACLRFGVGMLPYFPLASGLLTGRYDRSRAPAPGTSLAAGRWSRQLTDRAWSTVDSLAEFAKDRSISMMDVAIGGLAAQPGIASVIAGATSVEQVLANAAAGAWEPGAADLAELDRITTRSNPNTA